MKRRNLLVFLGLLVLFPSLVHSQPIPPFDKIFERWGPRIHPSDLRVLQLEMSPDPVWEGQRVRFEATISNLSHHFPYSRYTFQRFDHCFTVIVDVERTPYRTDAAREFCAKPLGWTLKP